MTFVVSTGEQVTIGLLCMALLERGSRRAAIPEDRSAFTPTARTTKARIRKIDEGRMRADLAEGRLVVVAGFQGVDAEAMSLRSAAADRTPLPLRSPPP